MEFEIHCKDDSKHWECDKCCVNFLSTLPFNDLDTGSWLKFNEIKINHNNMSDEIICLHAMKQRILYHNVTRFKT